MVCMTDIQTTDQISPLNTRYFYKKKNSYWIKNEFGPLTVKIISDKICTIVYGTRYKMLFFDVGVDVQDNIQHILTSLSFFLSLNDFAKLIKWNDFDVSVLKFDRHVFFVGFFVVWKKEKTLNTLALKWENTLKAN